MRDLFVCAVVFGSLPLILKRPWVGILMWCWLSYMNPHRLAWGFAYSFPFAMMVALTTLAGMLFGKEAKKLPWERETKILLVLIGWMIFTTFFALVPNEAWEGLNKVLKIQLMTLVTLVLINSQVRVHAMVWAIALSLVFFGIKGGIFTIAHGGAYRVQGPTGSFIGGNNELALALVMTIPLMRYLHLNTAKRWLRWGLGGAIVLTTFAAIGSQSRGALLALSFMGGIFWLKSRNKLATALIVCVAIVGILSIMPPEYYARMSTIRTYDQDASALGRINAWWFAFNLSKARPIVGGGFEVFRPWLFDIYAPDPDNYHDVHSIYFEMLGEHGYVGLVLFLSLGICSWLAAGNVRKKATQDPQQKWLADLMSMTQASLAGFAVGGAFLGLAYFDLFYHLVALVIIGKRIQNGIATDNTRKASAHEEHRLATTT